MPFGGGTMEKNVSSSFMVMYENESVDVRYGNGAQLQLSPCGCEFMLMKPTDPSEHPLQTRGRVRQRTRFATSTYKEMIMTALAFRNKYASRPYLPEELIPAGHKKPFFSIDSDVNWPECSLCDAEFGPGGETIIRSEDGRIVLTLSPSGEEFSVEFTCSLSHYQTQHHSMEAFSRDSEGGPGGQQQVSNLICQTAGDKTKEVHQGSGSRRNKSMRSWSCSPRITSTAQSKPEGTCHSTAVVQHHSCRSVAPIWCYPLSLARHLQMAHFSKPEDVRGEGARDITPAHRETNVSDVARHSHLPQALPLTCLSPHWHRWNFTDLRAKKEHDLPTELVKVMWCQGVTYRILSGGLIEVSPGDGSVIRSNGVLNTYFTHHKPEILSGQLNVKEVTYHVNNLPPDLPGQLYSVCSVVSRASRMLTCYNEAKHSLTLLASPSCLQEVGYFCKPVKTEENLSYPVPVEQHVNVTRTAVLQSDLVAAELEKIKRFNFLLDKNPLLGIEKPRTGVESGSDKEAAHEALNENCIAEALRRTSKVKQDIDALISAATLT